ncbi:MAG TPA: SDR family NAD(P)-dependent oxidoreductase, partial [Enhygromyxa sp.]|nr:SDR family NAD(P)-dependent oxidoreductase [Enhygromyxa sp.]
MRRLDDKLVVITGAAGGIGSALARAFAARKAALALIDLDADALDRLAQSLPGATVSTHVANVGDPASLAAAREAILEHHGRVDVLVNNAGITVFADFESTEPVEIERVLSVNLRGVIYGCKIFLPDLRARPQAHIVNVSSMAGLAGMPWQTLYCASKFAVRGFTASLRAELLGRNVGVTCVLPGTTRTNIVAAAASRNPQLRDRLSGLLLAYGYPPEWLARKLVRAIRRNQAELRVGPDSWMLSAAVRVSPMLVRAS